MNNRYLVTILSCVAISAPTVAKSNVINVSAGNSSDYSYITKVINSDDSLSSVYYKLNINKDELSSSQNIIWNLGTSADTNKNFTITLPQNDNKNYFYTLSVPQDYANPTAINTSKSSDGSSYKNEDVIGGLYMNNSAETSVNKVYLTNNYVTASRIQKGHSSYDYELRGGTIYNVGTLNGVNADFDNNYMTLSNSSSENTSDASVDGGSFYNANVVTGTGITGNFINNYVTGTAYAPETSSSHVRTFARGGAIVNSGTINKINANFINNYAMSTAIGAGYNYGYTEGGAIWNVSDKETSQTSGAVIDLIEGKFIGNRAIASYGAYGGAIVNGTPSATSQYKAVITKINADFFNNQAKIENKAGKENYTWGVYGGAIYNFHTIDTIEGNFVNNSAIGLDGYAIGGAINNSAGTINKIKGSFYNNYVSGNYSSEGGAIAIDYADNFSVNSIEADFIGNYVVTQKNGGFGGAIYGKAKEIKGLFSGNYVSQNGSVSLAEGGALYGGGESIYSTFVNNYASSNSGYSHGGAVYIRYDTGFKSGKDSLLFADNYTYDTHRGKIYNALFVTEGKSVTFDTSGGGNWNIYDNIEGGKDNSSATPDYTNQYNLSFTGDDTLNTTTGTTTQYININNAIINAGEVKVENTTLRFNSYQHEDTTAKNSNGKGKFISALDSKGNEVDGNSVTSLVLNNAVFDISNGYLETVKLKKYSATDSFVHLDVNPDTMKSDVLNINGNVEGVTKLIVHAMSDKDITGQGSILFAESVNDTTGTNNSFVLSRIYGSPYMYDITYTKVAKNSNKWEFEMTDEENPNDEEAPVDPNPSPNIPTPEIPDVPTTPEKPLKPLEPIAPEIIVFESLPNAGLAQTNGMIYNVMRKVGISKLYCKGCGFYDYNWNGKAFHNAWVDITYNGLTIEAPVEIDAKVWGIEAGSDLQHDLNNKLGIFVSYRQGNYEMDGKGEKYYSTIGSEIDIDSYLAGLYYRYDKNNWYAFATVYGGMQNAEIKTDDGVSADTDGIEFGGSVEAGYNYALTRTLSVTPSLGVFYSQISYDDATDNVGKTVEYNDLKQVELEAGAKFAYTQYTDDGFYSLYVKPSVVQTLVDGDEIEVTKLGKVDTIEDKTLGRVEIGGNYGFNDNWSAYGWANYTFGSDYEATSLGAGVNYSW